MALALIGETPKGNTEQRVEEMKKQTKERKKRTNEGSRREREEENPTRNVHQIANPNIVLLSQYLHGLCRCILRIIFSLQT
jgi:hypothetical protein